MYHRKGLIPMNRRQGYGLKKIESLMLEIYNNQKAIDSLIKSVPLNTEQNKLLNSLIIRNEILLGRIGKENYEQWLRNSMKE